MPIDVPTAEQLTRRALRARASAAASGGERLADAPGAVTAGTDSAPAVPMTRRQRRAQAARPAGEAAPAVVARDEPRREPAPEARVAAPQARVEVAPEPRAEAAEPPAAAGEPKGETEPPDPRAEATSTSQSCEDSDPFLEAVRAFGATGETPIQRARTRASSAPSAHVPSPRATDPRRLRRILTTTTASLGAMGLIGMLAVGLTTPVGALAAPAEGQNPAALAAGAVATAASGDAADGIQAFVAPADVAAEDLGGSVAYESSTYADIAAASGINTDNAAFVNDPTADIQWPFAVGVSISSPYGYRWGRLHEGVDFTPGAGAPVQAVADGTVRVATEAGGAYGVNVYIDHVIDGQLVSTHYAHLQYGSLRVAPGQQVKVGDVIGLTGNTGRSYGAHLHFEVIIGGTPIDPLPWLHKWAGTHFPDEPVAEMAGETGTAEE